MHPGGAPLREEAIYSRVQAVERARQGLPATNGFRRAAVLIPLAWKDEEWQVLFTRRTETVQSHKGQVSFPGGAVEPGDRTLEDTARRETYEEIGLAPDQIRIVGRLHDYPTISDFLITPIVGLIPWPVSFQVSEKEVQRVFFVPLHWLAKPAHFEERPYLRQNGKVEPVIYYQLYDGEMVWGVTGRITVNFLKILGMLSEA